MRSCPWRFSVFLLGSRQLLLILSRRAGYRLCPVRTVLCLWTGSFTASLFKSFQAHDQHYLLKTVSDGWALRTKKTQREREMELDKRSERVCQKLTPQYAMAKGGNITTEAPNRLLKEKIDKWKNEEKGGRKKNGLDLKQLCISTCQHPN